MKEIIIDIDTLNSPGDVKEKLKNENARKGDHVRFLRSRNVTAFQLVSVLAFMFLFLLQKSRKVFAEKVIDNLFGKYNNVEELETEIEKEYGIRVTVESKEDPDREDWMRMSAIQFESGFSDPDDDYSDVPILEPNPDYIPWKKETS